MACVVCGVCVCGVCVCVCVCVYLTVQVAFVSEGSLAAHPLVALCQGFGHFDEVIRLWASFLNHWCFALL